jgi:hypothetical protein
MHASGDEPGEVRHVHQVERANLVGDLPHAGEVDGARIGRASADDELGLLAHGDGFHLVIVERLGFASHAVADDVESFAAEAELVSVSEVSAMGEVESHDGVAGLNDGEVGGHVGRGAGVRLYVGVLGSEDLLGTVARKILNHVGELASSVVALGRIALGIFVGEDRAGSLKHSFADKVLRGDQLKTIVLTVLLVGDGLGNLGINRTERTQHR